MTIVVCDYRNCKYNDFTVCNRTIIHVSENLHDGAVCMDTHFVNKREEVESGKGGQTIRQEKD